MRVIDAQTGFLANEWCPVRMQEYFKPGTEPTDPCPYHGPDAQSQDSGSPQTGSQNPGDWTTHIGKQISKALGKIFKF
jgi:Membrane carboxypeptidase/penicillin-binding protein